MTDQPTPSLDDDAPEAPPAPPAPPLVPLPAAILKVWESFVLDQARQGKTHVERMVPALISQLAERAVTHLRPDAKRKQRFERWREALAHEVQKVRQSEGKVAAGRLLDGYVALDLHRGPRSDAVPESEAGWEPTYLSEWIFSPAELAEHHKAVLVLLSQAEAMLRSIVAQEEAMATQRMQMMMRLSQYSGDLLQLGHNAVNSYRAEQSVKATGITPADMDAALVAMGVAPPPPIQVTYSDLFRTLGHMVQRWLAPVMALEPPVVTRYRRLAWYWIRAQVAPLVARLERHRQARRSVSDSDKHPP